MRKYATHETIANTPHTELQHVNKHVKGKHTNTYKRTQAHIPNPEGPKNKTYYIHKTNHTEHHTIHTCKAQTIQRCKQNQKHVKQCNIYKHQRENNACLMSTHKYFDRVLSVYKNRAATIKSKCFNRSNRL